MPRIGMGTAALDTVPPYLSAIKLGYRYFDTAMWYDNEHIVGQALT